MLRPSTCQTSDSGRLEIANHAAAQSSSVKRWWGCEAACSACSNLVEMERNGTYLASNAALDEGLIVRRRHSQRQGRRFDPDRSASAQLGKMFTFLQFAK